MPFLYWHGLPAGDIWGFAALIAGFGVIAAWSYANKAKAHGDGAVSEEWRTYFAIFPATFAVLLQSILVAAASFDDTGSIVSATTPGRVMLAAGPLVFGLSLILPARLLVAARGRPSRDARRK